MNTEKHTYQVRNLLNEFVGGGISIKRLFSGYGLFYENVIFGICRENIFYLKAEEELSTYLVSKGAVSWVLESDSNLAIANYYRLPLSVTEDKTLYKKIVLLAIEQIKNKAIKEAIFKKDRIKELANLSIKYERLLGKVDIKTVKELKAIGATNAYIRLKKAAFSVDVDFYLNLHAALQNKHVSLLTEKEKRQLLTQLNDALSEAGLRKIDIEKYLKKK